MTLAPERPFIATHLLHDIPVMKNPEWEKTHGFGEFWIDAEGVTHRSGRGAKAEAIGPDSPIAPRIQEEGAEFGVTYARVGEVIPSQWYTVHHSLNASPKGVMATREMAGCVLRACAYPDSDAPCGIGADSKDDEATFVGKDSEGNSIVRLFMRNRGFVMVKIPHLVFMEIIEA